MIAKPASNQDILDAEKEGNTRHFFTTFEHINVHKGFRRGVISGYIGTPGSGKSSLFKTHALQASSTPDTRVLHWLSEESKSSYAVSMLKYARAAGIDMDGVSFFEESSLDHRNHASHGSFLAIFKEIVVHSFADIVFIDNVTTSRLYSVSIGLQNQIKTVEFLKDLAKTLNIAIVYLAHTSSEVSDNMGRLFTTEDIKGSKDLPMQTAYFYALQKFTQAGKIHLTLRTLKSRFHQDAFGTYLLKYEPSMGVYIGDTKVEFDVVKEIFKSRDKLQ